jgi:tetratricopeptide (TPR) repeat protein
MKLLYTLIILFAFSFSENIDFYDNMGRAYFEKGEYKKAVESYEKIIELIPKDSIMTSDVYYRMGDCYIHLKQYENAIHFTEMGIGLNPESYAYYNIGFSYRHLAQYHKLPFYNKAIENFEKAIELNPEYAKAYHTMGLAYGQWGFDDKAVENIRKSAKLGYEESQNWLKEYEKRFQRRVMIFLISIGGILLWAL